MPCWSPRRSLWSRAAEGGFQIFITPWDEPETVVVTPERIRRDVPSMKIKNPQTVFVGDEFRALMFESDGGSVGSTREVWVIGNGSLFQITAPMAFDAELAAVMQTWKFE